MRKVFLDTNILLDVLLRREEFYQASATVFTTCSNGNYQGLIASISVQNAYYFVRKMLGRATAIEDISLILGKFQVIPSDARIFHQALHYDVGDYEDSVQLASAIIGKASCLITRNPQDFSPKFLPILTPQEFLQSLG